MYWIVFLLGCLGVGMGAMADIPSRVMDRMTHFEQLPTLETDVRTYEFSSFKRIAEAADKNSWLYEQDGERVMFQDEGPGCVTRLWITGVSDYNSRLSFYFDGETNASFSATPYELYQSGMFPYPLVAGPSESAGGRVSYIPIPYEKSLMITDSGNSAIRYYNITYENYAEGTAVDTWSGLETYEETARYLTAGADPKPVAGNQYFLGNAGINAGDDIELLNMPGSGVVQSLEFDFDAVSFDVLDDCRISMEFDGTTTVDAVPLAEFFGSAVGEVEVQSLPVGMRTNGNWYCYFPMPYWESVRVRIENSSHITISNFTYKVGINSDALSPETAGYFHARHREASYSDDAGDLVLFDESGCAGKFVGVSLYMEGLGGGFRGMLYLEGDVRVYVDGSEHPFIHGTGNEDWFNGAYYYNDYADQGANQEQEIFCMPFHGLPAKYHCQGADSWTQAYRFNISDSINWTSSLLFTIEHGQYPAYEGGYYSCVAYSYQRPAAASYQVAEITALNAYDHFYECDGDLSTNTAKFITPRAEVDAPEITLIGFSNVMHSGFSVGIPAENDGVILQALSDFSAGTNSAVVAVGGHVVGRWSQVDQNYTNSAFGWGINEVFIPANVTRGKNRLNVSIAYSAPATEFRFKVLPLSEELTLGIPYQNWILQYSDLRSFTNLTDNFDGDAYDNFAEYVYGGNPEEAEDLIHTIGMFRKYSEGHLAFTYPKRTDESLAYTVEYCDNLVSNQWNMLEPLYEMIETPENGLGMVTNVVPILGQGFFRLRVENH